MLLGNVVADFPQTADNVLRTHILKHSLKSEQLPALEVGLHVVHDGRNVGAVLQLLLRELVEDLLWLGAGESGFDAEGIVELIAEFAGDDVLLTRGCLEALDERAALQIRQKVAKL